MKLLRMTLIVLACAMPALGLAQWQWIDKDGRKVYSDQSPPADIPAKNILKQPAGKGGRSVTVNEPAPASSAPAVAAAKPAATPQLSGKDKALEDKKKAADAEAAEKKKAQEEEVAKQRSDFCARTKRSKAAIDSGARIARSNDKGEREFMEDAERATEGKRLDAILAKECQPT
jgi:type IV secretory pathway VirB10-like protein